MVRRDFLESMIDRAASGRTVFLSSHQVSEVERVADTIGILHDGKIKICCPLSELKDSITELTVSLDDPLIALPQLPAPAEVLSEGTYGRQRRMVVRFFEPEMQSLLSDHTGVASVRRRDLSLEEIFIACTEGLDAAQNASPTDQDEANLQTTNGSTGGRQ